MEIVDQGLIAGCPYHQIMYDSLPTTGKKLPKQEGDVLSVSNSTNLIDILGIAAISCVEANYPEHNILSLPFPDRSFDFVLSDQVLEQLYLDYP